MQADCGTGIGLSNTVGPFTFTTTCPGGLSATVTHTITAVTCNGGSDGSIDVMVTGGASPFAYAWDNGDSTAVISGLMAGTYIVTITDGNGCPGSETYTISEPAALVISVSAIADTSGAGVGSATATVTGGTAPYTYEWNGTVGTDMLTGLTMGTYLLSVTDANGCSDTLSVSVDDATSTNTLDYLNNLSIHPNPTQGNLMINIELAKAANVGITVHTITGLLIADLGNESTTQQTQTIDLSSYAEGMYFVRFVIDNHVITKKVILMK